MDGVHDLAGVQGFGPVKHTLNNYPDGPFQTAEFHEDWEYLGYALFFVGVQAGLFSVDEVRHVVERLEPRYYMGTPYYERYVVGVASLMVEKGAITKEELEAAAGGSFPLARPLISEGRPAMADKQTFEVGDRVRVRDEQVSGHIRVPRYAFGKEGTVQHRTTHEWPFPDAIGHGRDDGGAEPTYHVVFEATDLFGADTDASSVVLDLFEGYLEPAA